MDLTYEQAKELAQHMNIDIEGLPEHIAIKMMGQFADKMAEAVLGKKSGPKVEEIVDEEKGLLLKVNTLSDKGSIGIGTCVPGKVAPMLCDFMVSSIKHLMDTYQSGEIDDHEFKSLEEAVGQYFLDVAAGLAGYFNDNPKKHDELGEDVFRVVTGLPVGKKTSENPMFG